MHEADLERSNMHGIPPFPAGLETVDLPRISLAKLQAHDDVEGARLFQACIEHGCFSLELAENAGVSDFISDVDEAFSAGSTVFDALLEEKMKFPKNHRNIGYKPTGVFKIADGGRDEVEIYGLGKDQVLDPSRRDFAAQFVEKRGMFADLITSRLDPLCALVLETIEHHLELPASTLRDLHSKDITSSTVLRFLHYLAASPSSGANPAQTKLLGHTDNGSLTVLFTRVGGLQILSAGADESDGTAWKYVEPVPGCAFVNVGDSLVEWTGGVLRSVYHRVVRPPGEQAGMERYSFGYFLKPVDSAPMQPLQLGLVPASEQSAGEPVRYEDWHQAKSKNIEQGVNSASRGGTVAIQWRQKHLVATHVPAAALTSVST